MVISRRDVVRLTGLTLLAMPAARVHAAAGGKVHVGALKFGTVSWELDTIKHHGLDSQNGIDVEVTYFAGEDATNVAMLAGNVDMIVTDWLWVSRQRSSGNDVTLVPYSSAVGAIMVKDGSPIATPADLVNRKIGVAGGPLDKSWLLLQAMFRRDYDIDLPAANEVVFGAPPLMSEKAVQGELDAVLNFWHFCARLEANSFRRLVGASDAAMALGAHGPVAAIGYVFHDSWARENPQAIAGFVKASAAAKKLLAASDGEWLRLAPLIRAEGAELQKLRDRYREGIPDRPVADEEADAATLYRVLAEIGGEKLVGSAREMASGTFWRGPAA